jgi:nitroimidazol reductase NimA-like FMN-containing flavoprotein (pyridoxamine 5'-phosphate oxidase superfamily)
MDINMTPGEIKVFLAEQKVCRMATVGKDGMPHVIPMWYVILGGEIYIETTGTTKKVKNVKSTKKTALIVDAGDSLYDYMGVMMQGKTEIVKDKAIFGRFREAYAQRYFGSNEHPGYKLLTGIPNRVLLKFIPEKFASWDYRKMKF